MSDSLRDQFMKLGFNTTQPLKKKPAFKPQAQAQNFKKTKPSFVKPQTAKPVAAVEKAPTISVDEKKKAGEARKALFQQLRQIALTNRLNDENADIVFYFQHQQHIKKMYLTAQQKAQLLDNELCIVNVKTRYHLVTPAIAQTMYEILAESRVILEDNSTLPQTDNDDPYSAYSVPDDLMW